MKARIQGTILKKEIKTVGKEQKSVMEVCIWQESAGELVKCKVSDASIYNALLEGKEIDAVCTINAWQFNGKYGLSVRLESYDMFPPVKGK